MQSKPKKLPTRPLPFVFYFVRRHIGYYLPMALCVLMWPLYNSLAPFFIKLLVDSLTNCPSDGNVWQAIAYPFGGLVCTIVAIVFFIALGSIINIYAKVRLREDIHNQVVDYVFGHSLAYFNTVMAGKISTRIHELRKESEAFINRTIWTGSSLIAFLFASITLCHANLFFGIVMFVWGSLHIGIISLFMGDVHRKNYTHARSVMEMDGQVLDLIKNIISVRLATNQKQTMEKVNRCREEEKRASKLADWAYQRSSILCSVVWVLFMIGMFYGLVEGWQAKKLTLGDFSMVTMTSLSMSRIIWSMNNQLSTIVRQYGIIDDALLLIKTEHEITDVTGAKPLVITDGEIVCKDITFSYGGDDKKEALFEKLSLTFHKREKIGLVGTSGSGKTTLIQLLLRFFELKKGQILIDGQDISQITQESLRSQIGMIAQNYQLFHASILDNIRYGKPEATFEEVVAASKRAHCHDFIQELPEGYHTPVGERSSKVSGGQRQRIAIARTILSDSKILFLDEATSALDMETEKEVQLGLEEVMKGSTTIVIAHRLQTLKNMDRIVVFDRGTIIEEGTYKELEAKEGGYFATIAEE